MQLCILPGNIVKLLFFLVKKDQQRDYLNWISTQGWLLLTEHISETGHQIWKGPFSETLSLIKTYAANIAEVPHFL